ncbi:hypothetical protein TcasGA2_TC034386 [Tribolium castaneum]|uniref:Single domain-containing protein n=1 Tax=Tribolium castaneum TaxID=7070 RepID=A0A139WBD6_TRICA|nr:PREDICTED: uncharacterized protein LOC103314262 [Tribolium castaneum]KYB25268.1 hypothetical protein TcasGA2_TC034386 [Tribolium castaneum]|eukprot:XP_008198014.1 PREDICTED: uncharacterized protein LOC103314262 [Tribolium castaneum]
MMKILVILVLCVFYLNLNVEAALKRYTSHPMRKPGGCYHEKFGHLTATATVPLTEKCGELKCYELGWIQEKSCSVAISKGPECVDIPEDLKKPYPKCCPVKCDKH